MICLLVQRLSVVGPIWTPDSCHAGKLTRHKSSPPGAVGELYIHYSVFPLLPRARCVSINASPDWSRPGLSLFS